MPEIPIFLQRAREVNGRLKVSVGKGTEKCIYSRTVSETKKISTSTQKISIDSSC